MLRWEKKQHTFIPCVINNYLSLLSIYLSPLSDIIGSLELVGKYVCSIFLLGVRSLFPSVRNYYA